MMMVGGLLWMILLLHTIDSTYQQKICLPDNIEECTKSVESDSSDTVTEEDDFDDDEDLIGVRRFSRKGVRCSPQQRLFSRGSCNYPTNCRQQEFAYSRTCGLSMVCCSSITRTSRPSTSYKTSTRRPSSSRRTTSRPRGGGRPRFGSGQQRCGGGTGVNHHVLNGTEAPRGMFPFMVGLVPLDDDGEVFCGGVLISKNHVLTAAHCFDGVDWRRVDVRIGKH